MSVLASRVKRLAYFACSIYFLSTPARADSVQIVDNNVNANPISGLHGYCDKTAFTFLVYWEGPAGSGVELMDDASGTVLASGSTSPLTVTQPSSASDTLPISLRDQNDTSVVSDPVALNRRDCSIYSDFSSRSNSGPDYTVPAYVDTVRVVVVGGGGGGGGKSTNSGVNKRGGSGGGSAQGTFAVVPGDVFSYTIGAGGKRGGRVNGFQNGGAGGSSSLRLNGAVIATGNRGGGTTSNGNNVGHGGGGSGSITGPALSSSTANGANGARSAGGSANRFGVSSLGAAGNGGNGRAGNRGYGIAGQAGGIAIQPLTLNVAPTVTINQLGADPALDSNVGGVYRVVFSSPIDPLSFTPNDVNLTGSALAVVDAIAESAPFDGTTFDISILGANRTGNAIATIPAASVNTVLGVNNSASTSSDNIIEFNHDRDGDLIADAEDIDDDNDGVPDSYEQITTYVDCSYDNTNPTSGSYIQKAAWSLTETGSALIHQSGLDTDYAAQQQFYIAPGNFEDTDPSYANMPWNTSETSYLSDVVSASTHGAHLQTTDHQQYVSCKNNDPTCDKQNYELFVDDVYLNLPPAQCVGGAQISFSVATTNGVGLSALYLSEGHDPANAAYVGSSATGGGIYSAPGTFTAPTSAAYNLDENANSPFYMRLYNIDGIDPSANGNGVRLAARLYFPVPVYTTDGGATYKNIPLEWVAATPADANMSVTSIETWSCRGGQCTSDLGGTSAENILIAAGYPSSVLAVDSDGDAVADSTDLDSDNDGIADIYEAGNATISAYDLNGNGLIDAVGEGFVDDGMLANSVLGNGLDDRIENLFGGVSGVVLPVDSEAVQDGIADIIDLDSDNDGIPDAVEARATANHIQYPASVDDAADADDDGILDVFDSGIEFGSSLAAFKLATRLPYADPDDSADSLPDYLDLDSDGDSLSDDAEAVDLAVAPSVSDPDGSVSSAASILSLLGDNDTDDGNSTDVDFRSINDEDQDGNPDNTDTTDNAPIATDDGPVNPGNVLNILLNDDFLTNNDTNNLGTTTITQVASTGTCVGVPVFTANTGIQNYTRAANENFGGTCTYDYRVCNVDATPEVCADATVTVNLPDEDNDADGVSNSNEANAVDADDACTPNTDGVPVTKDCDGDGLNVTQETAAGTNTNDADTDGDGNPDATDPNPTAPTAKADAGEPEETIAILTNDDFLGNADSSNRGLTTINQSSGGTCLATPVFDAMLGTASYTAAAGENFGGTCDFNYRVCSNESGSNICRTASVSITLPDEDNDADGVSNSNEVNAADADDACTPNTDGVPASKDCDGDGLNVTQETTAGTNTNDADTDGDGNPDATDPNPTAPTAKADAGEPEETIAILANDDFLGNADSNNRGVTTINLSSGGSCLAAPVFDATLGTASYTAAAGENVGGTCDFNYQVCSNESGSNICRTAGVTINLADEDNDADGVTNSNEVDAAAANDACTPHTDGVPASKDCDGDGLDVTQETAAGTNTNDADTDGDGNPDATDPNPIAPTAKADSGVPDTIIDILGNDDFLTNADTNNEGVTLISEMASNTSCVGSAVFDATTGTMTYTADNTENLGGTCIVVYEVCNDESGTNICASAEITIALIADNDLDAIPDAQDLDDDNDGIPDVVEGDGDSDGDGLFDKFDLDSDNDGITDLVESGLSLITISALDTDDNGRIDLTNAMGANGLADAVETAPESGVSDHDGDSNQDDPIDSDGDSIPDYLDVDKDNDAITDIVESGMPLSDYSLLDSDADGRIDPTVSVGRDGIADAIQNDQDGVALDFSSVDTDGDNIVDALDIDSDDDGLVDLLESGINQSLIGSLDTDGDGQIDSAIQVSSDGVADAIQTDTTDGSLDFVSIDTDNDGLADALDLDSDNDGIPDLQESGITEPLRTSLDADGNGRVDASLSRDIDGVASSLRTDMSDISLSQALIDTDDDGTTDNLDLDKDNDAIPDLSESGLSAVEIASLDNDNSGQIDVSIAVGSDGIADSVQGGVDNAALSYFPADTDSDGILDPLDLDSDSDGLPDIIESGLMLNLIAGLDADSDGRIENTIDTGSDGLANTVQSGNDDGSLAYQMVDTDSDDVPDFRDLDADNDGLLDSDESGLKDLDGNGLADGDDGNNDGRVDIDGPTVINIPDADSDGVPDFREIDSDGDGTFDNAEPGVEPSITVLDSNADGIVDSVNDSDGDGIVETADGSPSTFGSQVNDSDGDGITDNIDLDDDNDGIPDSIEGATDADNDGINNYLDLDSDNDGIPDITETGLSITLQVLLDADNNGRIDSSRSFGVNGLADLVETADDANDIDFNQDGIADGPIDSDGDGVPDFLDVDKDNDAISDIWESGLAISDVTIVDADANGQIDTTQSVSDDGIADVIQNGVDAGSLVYSVIDTDADGVLNVLDLDSDSDGLPDVLESGLALSQIINIDSDFDGRIDSSVNVGSDGLADAIQLIGDGADVNFTWADTDSDGLPDAIDLDSDNDGLIDVFEAGLVDENRNGLADGDDSNSDGLVESNVANPQTIPDSDTDGIPDFREIDSDNDGINDNAEVGVDPFYNSLDTDGDGLIDDIADTDQDGIADAPDLAPALFGSGSDTDTDGVPDGLDLDIDNDGILNTHESNGDTDSDGIPDVRDLDSDSDGILDVLEGAEEGGSDLDADGDGIIDTFVDLDNNGVHDTVDMAAIPPDFDNDGIADHHDLDSDSDGIFDLIESGRQLIFDDNRDGMVDNTMDANRDGIADVFTGNTPIDSDQDGIADYRDLDSDNDGFTDEAEAAACPQASNPSDCDNNGIPDNQETGDGLITAVDGSGSLHWLAIMALVGLVLTRFNSLRQVQAHTALIVLLVLACPLPTIAQDNFPGRTVVLTQSANADDSGRGWELYRRDVHGDRDELVAKKQLKFQRSFYADIGPGVSNVHPEGSSQGFETDDALDTSSGYKLTVGQHFKPHWIWELSYADLGTAGLKNDQRPGLFDVVNSEVGQPEISYKIPAIWAGYYFRNPNNRFNVLAKVGVSAITNSANDNRIGYEKQTAVQVAFGIAAQWRLGSRFYARLGHDSYDTDANYTGVSVGMYFGGPRSDKNAIANNAESIAQTELSNSSEAVPEPDMVCLDLEDYGSKVRFATDSAELRPTSKQTLLTLAEKLKERNIAMVEIQGHTDSVGSHAYNERLSLRRAEQVKTYLTREAGVSESKLTVQGYGERKPIADNNTIDGRAQNRRVEFVQPDVACRR